MREKLVVLKVVMSLLMKICFPSQESIIDMNRKLLSFLHWQVIVIWISSTKPSRKVFGLWCLLEFINNSHIWFGWSFERMIFKQYLKTMNYRNSDVTVWSDNIINLLRGSEFAICACDNIACYGWQVLIIWMKKKNNTYQLIRFVFAHSFKSRPSVEKLLWWPFFKSAFLFSCWK